MLKFVLPRLCAFDQEASRYQAVAAFARPPGRSASTQRTYVVLAGLLVATTLVVWAGGEHRAAAALSGSATQESDVAALATTAKQLARLQQNKQEMVEGESLLKESAAGVQDSARLKNAAWLSDLYRTRPELAGLSPMQADAVKAKLIVQDTVKALEADAAQAKKKTAKLGMSGGQALQVR